MTLKQVKDLFLTITKNCYHYHAWAQPDKYIVWAEDGQADAVHSDNKMEIQVLQGTLDYFTKSEYDPLVNTIQQTMNSADMAWRLNSVQYEEDTKYIHYEWVWEVEQSVG